MKIAITGTIGSGKSEACNYLRSKGYNVFDCDKMNSELLKKGNLGYLEVKKAFPCVFDKDELNKLKLANLVFNDKEKKQELESIMHPLILEEMLKKAEGNNYFFAEVPLLFEVNWDKYFDHKIVIISKEDIAIERLISRGLSKNEAVLRINNQMPVEDRLKRADEIIYNNGSLSMLYEKIDIWLDKYVR